MRDNHMWMMMLACLVPLAIIVLLPLMGINFKWNWIGAIILMVVLHFWMMKDHRKNHELKGGGK